MPTKDRPKPASRPPQILDFAKVRAAIESGMRAYEVAERFGVSEYQLCVFMRRHGIAILATEELPPPDLSRPDRIVIWKSVADPVSGYARKKRISLPRNSYHVAAILEDTHV
jgi:hypothetical protein